MLKVKNKTVILILICGFIFTKSTIGFSQLADTLEIQNSASYQADDLLKPYKHSPHKATIYAAVIPGLGQIYNKKYWKLPILYAGIGGVIYAIQFNSENYDKYRSAYRDFLIRDPKNMSYLKVIENTQITLEDVHGPYADWFQRTLDNRRKYYRRYRDISYAGLVGVYLIQIIDATVDAHFKNFDISDDLSLNLEPIILSTPQEPFGGAVGFQLKFNF